MVNIDDGGAMDAGELDLSEGDAIETLAVLQRSLPDVAQKLCCHPAAKEHFLTLGPGKQG
jgi:UTP:GlnB (protein PII) uridylyltransferase